MSQAMRQIVIYRGEDGFFVVEVPSLPGCISQGRTKEEAIVNIQEAIQSHIESLKAHNQPIPVENFEGQIFVLPVAS